jgi:glycosyltransferase involved in cell wall biosynthesis
MGPRVSITLPFFNSSAFLGEAINSVRSQTFCDWELLLVDDGSTDESTSIAAFYARTDPTRISVVRHGDGKNHGLPVSRNLGLHLSRGKYVAQLDSDDVWLPDKLDRQVALLDQYPDVAMVYGKSEYWYDWAAKPLGANIIPILAPAPKIYSPPELLKITYPLGNAGSPCPSDLIFRRDAAKRIGGFVEDFVGPFSVYEDIAFLAKMSLSYPVYVSDECWDKYRIHSLSMTSLARRSGENVRAREFYFHWLSSYMRQNGVTDRKIWSLYSACTWEYRYPKTARLYRRFRAPARPLKRISKTWKVWPGAS